MFIQKLSILYCKKQYLEKNTKSYPIGSFLCFYILVYKLLVCFVEGDHIIMKNKMVVVLFFVGVLIGFAQQKSVVLELFTSQGCSSCPRADNLLRETALGSQKDNVIALAYHVDYWNRLGWRDPFSKTSFSEYQQQYGRKFGGRSIYTPQLVINGNKHLVGSDKSNLDKSLSVSVNKKLPVGIVINKVIKQGTKVEVGYELESLGSDRINVVMLLKEHITDVKRGENRNRKLLDAHIVIEKRVLLNKQKATVIFKEVNYSLDELEFVVYAQKTNLEVVGAAQWVH